MPMDGLWVIIYKINNMKLDDLTGRTFGNITVVSYSHRVINGSHYHHYWNCIDNDGYKKKISSSNLKSGRVKSCSGLNKRKRKHHARWSGYGDISGSYLYQIKSGAKIRNIHFSITIEFMWKLFLHQNKRCALSGVELTFPTCDRKRDGTASLDRIDSNKGYVKDNVQWVHKDLNIIKNNHDLDYFIEMCKNVAHTFEYHDKWIPKYSESQICCDPVIRNMYKDLINE